MPVARFLDTIPTTLIVCAILLVGTTSQAQVASEPARLAEVSLLLDADVSGDRVVAVGQRGHILLADKTGDWTQVVAPVQTLLTAVYMFNSMTGWIVGHDATILRTRDGGRSWTLVHYAPELELPLLDVWFRDERNGFAVGAFGLILATSDGGDSWNCRNGCDDFVLGYTPLLTSIDPEYGDDFHLNAIVPSDTGNLYIVAEAGMIYRSDDHGEHWQAVDAPYAGSWFGGLALDPNTILLAGLQGRLYRLDVRDLAWTRIESGTNAMLTDVVRISPQKVLVTGLAGTLLLSRDNGQTVSNHSVRTRSGFVTAVAAPHGDTLLFGEIGVLPAPAFD